MRIGRFIGDGEPRIVVFDDGSVTDITESVTSFRQVLNDLTAGSRIPTDGYVIDTAELTYLPPTTPENSVFALALNYQSHIDEGPATNAPEWPLVFLKLYRSLIGHLEPINHYTAITEVLDYEAELAVIIGEPAWRVDEADALDYVAGYTILNDTSARDVQRVKVGDETRLDWVSGKAMFKTTPVGPYMVTVDEIPDPQSLTIESRLNGQIMQDESTELMIRGVAETISFLSTRFELRPGDIIATGTPEGVGVFQDIQLDDGDEIEITIDEIGTLRNTVHDVDN